jgi:hypothetical protein
MPKLKIPKKKKKIPQFLLSQRNFFPFHIHVQDHMLQLDKSNVRETEEYFIVSASSFSKLVILKTAQEVLLPHIYWISCSIDR